jgi:hypothetical protein
MAKYLNKPCVDIDLKNIQISRKPTGDDGMYQTYYIFIGERLDEDGKILESFHEKVLVGSPGPDKWDSDTAELDVEAVAAATKALFENIHTDSTTTP